MVIGIDEGITTEWYYDKVTDMEISSLFKFVKPYLTNKRVLDLGCGTGRYLEHFSEDSIGLDASYESIDIIKRKGLKAIFGDLNEEIDFENNSFDLIFCSHVLEHVDSPINLLRECNRLLKEEGMIFVTVPNETNLPNSIGLDDYFGNHPEHIHSFSIKNLKVLLHKTGFEIERIYIDTYLMKKIFNISPVMGSHFLNIIQKIPKKMILPFSDEFMLVGKIL